MITVTCPRCGIRHELDIEIPTRRILRGKTPNECFDCVKRGRPDPINYDDFWDFVKQEMGITLEGKNE